MLESLKVVMKTLVQQQTQPPASGWHVLHEQNQKLLSEMKNLRLEHDGEIEQSKQAVQHMRDALRRKIEDDREAEANIRLLEAALDEQVKSAQETHIDRSELLLRIGNMRSVLRRGSLLRGTTPPPIPAPNK